MSAQMCPVLAAATLVKKTYDPNAFLPACQLERCAWWDEIAGRCSIVSNAIAASVEIARREAADKETS